jgi:uncharacterized protein GlcG (DUF336 family)
MPSGIVTTRDAGLELADRLLAGVRDAAAEDGLAMAAAVLDRGGQLVAAMRMDGAQICAVPLAIDKAFTAVAVHKPTEAWAQSTQPGGSDWGFNTTLGGRIVVFAGGMPIVFDDEVIGGLGVSGGAAHQDKACAESALRAAGLA